MKKYLATILMLFLTCSSFFISITPFSNFKDIDQKNIITNDLLNPNLQANENIAIDNAGGKSLESSYSGSSGSIVRRSTLKEGDISGSGTNPSVTYSLFSRNKIEGVYQNFDYRIRNNRVLISSSSGDSTYSDLNGKLASKDGVVDTIESNYGLVSSPQSYTYGSGYITLNSITTTSNSMTITNLKACTDGSQGFEVYPLPDYKATYYPYVDGLSASPYTESYPQYADMINRYPTANTKSQYTFYDVTSTDMEYPSLLSYCSSILAQKEQPDYYEDYFTWYYIASGDALMKHVIRKEPRGSAILSCDNNYAVATDGLQSISITNLASMPSADITAASIQLRLYTTAWGFWENQVDPSSSGSVLLTYADGTTETLTFDTSSTTNKFAEITIPFVNLAKLPTLREFKITVSINPSGYLAEGFIMIDYCGIILGTRGNYMAESIYFLETPFTYSQDPRYGIDLGTQAYTLSTQIDSLTISYKATFPAFQTGALRYVMNYRPKLADPVGSTSYGSFVFQTTDFEDILRSDVTYGLTTSENTIDRTITLTNQVEIKDLLSTLCYYEKYSSKYLLCIGFRSDIPLGSYTNTRITVDYLNIYVHFTTIETTTTSFNMNRLTDRLEFIEAFSPATKYGISPYSCKISNIPDDYVFDYYTYTYGGSTKSSQVSGEALSHVLTSTSITFPISGSSDFHVYYTSENYMDNASASYSREVYKDVFGYKNRIALDKYEFLRNDVMRIDAYIDYLKTDINEGVLTVRIEDQSDTILYTFNLNRDYPNRGHFYASIDLTNVRDLEYNGVYNLYLMYFNGKTSFNHAGFLYVNDAFKIKPNYISTPLYDVDPDNIYFNFTTNAKTEYSAFVALIDTKSKEFVGETQNYTINATSNNIILKNIYVRNPYIKTIRTYIEDPNSNITMEFENLGVSSTHFVIDDFRIIPYFYHEETFDMYLMRLEDQDGKTLDSHESTNISYSINFTGANKSFSRGIYTVYVKFHEDSYDFNETISNCTLFAEWDSTCYGNLYNYTIIEGLTGEQIIGGNFTKSELASKFVCYIQDQEGDGETSASSYYHGYFFGNQYTPDITIISPYNGAEFSTSYIQISTQITDPNDDLDKVYLRYYNYEVDSDYLYVEPSPYGYFRYTLNPFDLVTGVLQIEIMANDTNENYACASIFINVKSYKRFDLTNETINIGHVNAYTSLSTVPCNIRLNYSKYTEDFITTAYLDLGADYTDAKTYKIQRSPINIYYPVKNSSLGISDIGRYSYWEFKEYNENDTLQFTLNTPIATVELDNELTVTNHKEYFVYLKRHTNIRSYSFVSVIMMMTQPYEKYSIRIFDITGGENITITDSCYLTAGLESSSSFSTFMINFTVPEVLEGVDYAYKVIIENAQTREEYEAEGRTTEIIYAIALGIGFAIMIRILLSYTNNQKLKLNKRNMAKNFIIVGIIGAVIGFLFGYYIGFT